jgi:hypothetical protein
MDTSARSSVVRIVVVAALCGLTVFGLASCKDTASANTKSTPTSASSSTSASSPSARPTESMSSAAPPVASATPAAPAPVVKGTAMGVTCTALLTPQVIYDFNPNFSLQSGFAPKSGTDASKAVGYQGLACSWINQTSSDLITVSAAHPSDLSSLKATASSGTTVSGLGNAAYFKTTAGVGELQIFDGPFWITLSSDTFGTADDARDLASAAISTVK